MEIRFGSDMRKRIRTGILILGILLLGCLPGSSMLHMTAAAASPIQVNKASVNVVVGTSTKIKTLSAHSLKWSSSNKKIATVTKKGTVKGIKSGHCKVTGKASTGEKITLKVNVYKNTKTAAKKNSLTLIGHRGNTDKYPENSLSGVKSVKKQGWAGAETDVYYTNEHEFVCFHDTNLLRVCGSRTSIYNITKANRSNYTLKKVRASNRTEHIPLLSEMLAVSAAKKQKLFIHLRISSSMDTAAVRKLEQLIRHYGMQDRVVIFSYHAEVLRQLAEDGLTCGLFNDVGTDLSAVDLCVANGYKYLVGYKPKDINLQMVQYAHQKGITIGMCMTKKKSELMHLMDIGADFAFLYHILA